MFKVRGKDLISFYPQQNFSCCCSVSPISLNVLFLLDYIIANNQIFVK
jgi:hypothetical protein